MIAESRGLPSRKTAELLAVEALGWLAGNDEAMERFMSLAGLTPDAIREAARYPGFLSGVLDFLTGDEQLVLAFAAYASIPPERVVTAQRMLNGYD